MTTTNSETQKLGQFYSVGVGPGDPDLLTIKAVNILKQVDVIGIPQSRPGLPSLAWRVSRDHLGDIEGQVREFLTFPMVKDANITAPALKHASDVLLQHLRAGLNVAFITMGDPMIYSTAQYLVENIQEAEPEIEIEIVPGVSAISAVPAMSQIPVADGQERFAVLPASYGLDVLPQMLDMFDTLLLMKVSSIMPELVDILHEKGLLENSVYVTKATMPEQRIIKDLRSIRNDKCDYFSMVVVSKRTRSGILSGRVPMLEALQNNNNKKDVA